MGEQTVTNDKPEKPKKKRAKKKTPKQERPIDF